MMKKKLNGLMAVFLCLIGLSSNPSLAATNDYLTGDTKLACEALLCLSAAATGRPSECIPSVTKFFSLDFTNPADTIKARTDFLNMCPSSNEAGMQDLINSLVKGCFASDLNKLVDIKRVPDNSEKGYHEVKVIRNVMPDYCVADPKAVFVGKQGVAYPWPDYGHWVDK
jgi:hypothetical protein